MSIRNYAAAVALTSALIASAALFAQQRATAGSAAPKSGNTTQSNPGTVPASTSNSKTNSHQSCAAQAGISPATIAQRRQIEELTRSQIEGVCTDSSLSDQQKHQKIRDLRQSAHEQLSKLITPEQFEALRKCQRSNAHPASPNGAATHSAGPCGETK